MADAYYSGDATVLIGAASAASSDCTDVTTFISNFSHSGGTQDRESIKLYGGASINRRMPRSDVEVSFDFVAQGSGALYFEQLAAGTAFDGTTAVSSDTDAAEKVVYVTFTEDDSSDVKTFAYNNAICTVYNTDLDAEGLLSGSVTLKLSATNESGTDNWQVVKAAASTVSW